MIVAAIAGAAYLVFRVPSRPVLLCYGDSIVSGYGLTPTDAFPAQVQTRRPDLRVVAAGLAGDASGNVARYAKALARYRPALVVIAVGINDPVCRDAAIGCEPDRATPRRTVRNLRRLVRLARRYGADVYVLTPTPVVFVGAPCGGRVAFGGCPEADRVATDTRRRSEHAEAVAGLLRGWRHLARRTVVDVRSAFSEAEWPALSLDGLHPNREGHAVIAAVLTERLPTVRVADESGERPRAVAHP